MERRGRWTGAGLAWLVVAAGCGGDPAAPGSAPGPFPEAPAVGGDPHCWPAVPQAASLPVDPPKGTLWRFPIEGAEPIGAVVRAREVFGARSEAGLFVLDGQGQRRSAHGVLGRIRPAPPTADEASGTFFLAAGALEALNGTAAVRWSQSLPEPNTVGLTAAPVVDRAGSVYAVNLGWLVAHRIADGAPRWRAAIRAQFNGYPLVGGDETGIVVNAADEGFSIFAAADGALVARVPASPGTSQGVLRLVGGSRYLVVQTRAIGRRKVVMDRSGHTLWALPLEADGGTRWDLLGGTLEGELLIGDTMEGVEVSPRIHRTRCNGERVGSAGLTLPPGQRLGVSAVAGADGWFYLLTQQLPSYSDAGVTLLALDSTLTVRWTLAFPDRMQANAYNGAGAFAPVLREDGLLIFGLRKRADLRGEVVAIQTASPGLAPFPHAHPRADNGSSGWFTR